MALRHSPLPLLWVVLACGPPTPGAPARGAVADVVVAVASSSAKAGPLLADADAVLDADAIFVADAAAKFPRRAVLSRLGPLRLDRVGTEVALASEQPLGLPLELIVLEDARELVRVLSRSENFEIALYVRAGDLLLTNRHPARLTLPAALPSDAVVDLAPGAPLIVDATPGKVRRVTLRDDRLVLDGSLPVESVGRVFVPQDLTLSPATHRVERDTDMLLAPEGPRLGRITTSTHGRPVGAPDRGFRKIRIEASRYSVTAWVREDSLRAEPAPSRGSGAGFGWGGSSVVRLRRGTVIYGSARGVQIGRVLEHEIVRERHELEAGRVRVAFYASPFGFVDAWVTEEDVRLAKELEAAERRDAERITFQSFVVKGDLGDAREAVTERRLELARCMRTGSAAAPREGAFRATVLLTPDGLTESVVVSDLGAGLREVQGFRECAETALRETAWPRPTRPAKTAGSIRFSARLTPQKP